MDVQTPETTFGKKVFFQTWGCQMNSADSDRMLALLEHRNFKSTPTPDDADLIVLNTCHIREKARHKVVSRLGELRPLIQKRPDTILAVSGCVAQAEAKILAKEVPYLDLIFGPDQIEDLPNMLEKISTIEGYSQIGKEVEIRKGALEVSVGFKKDEGYSIPIDVIPPYLDKEAQEVSKYVNIVKGCNNFCTFCVVPYTRGREKSRSAEEIVKETQYLVDNGIKEIVLLGQNVNSYGLDLIKDRKDFVKVDENELPFVNLLYKIAEIEGLERIRFTTSNPHDFTLSLAKAFKDLPKITDQFHLPVQSGSDKILDRMNRQYTRAQYFERVGWIRDVRPNIGFSTDIIVGFPGETDQDFEDTMSLVQEMNYSFIYAFKYSPRRGTPAVRFKDTIDEKVQDMRLQKLISFQKEITLKQHLAEIGREREVLALYKNKKEQNTWYGRTYEGRLVKIMSSENLLGKLVNVKISGANLTALEGSPA